MKAKYLIAAFAVALCFAGAFAVADTDDSAAAENVGDVVGFNEDDVHHEGEISYHDLHIWLTIGILAFAAACVGMAIYVKLYGEF